MIHRLLLIAYLNVGILHSSFSQLDPSMQWQHSYGGSYHDDAYSIYQTMDGGFIVTGASASADGDVLKLADVEHGGDFDYWIAKIDPASNIQWKKRLGGTASEIPTTIYQTFDGGYVIGGHAESNDVDVSGNHGLFDLWIVKLFASGSIQWSKCFGGTAEEFLGSIEPAEDGGIIMCGSTKSTDGDVSGTKGSADFWIVKCNAAGVVEWQKCFGGSGFEKANKIISTNDGGFCLVGYTESNDGDVTGNHGDYDALVVKTDGTGNIVWQKCFGGSKLDNLNAARQLADGSFIFLGNTNSNDGDVSGNHGESDVWLLKTDVFGNFLWSRCYGGSLTEEGTAVEIDNNDQIIISGFAASADGDCIGNYGSNDFWLIRTDSVGDLLWQDNYGGSESDACFAMQIANDGSYILAGNSSSNDNNVGGNHGQRDYWITRINNLVGVEELNIQVSTIFPQPAKNQITIKGKESTPSNQITEYEIMEISGRKMKSFRSNRDDQITVDVSDLSPGMYLLKENGGGGLSLSKFIKQ